MRRLPLILFLAGCTASGAPTNFDCGGPKDLCEVDGGQYLALVPESWDGQSPLPTFIHFHGYGGTAVKLYEKASFTDPMAEVGALAIYPDGMNETWAHNGSPSTARDELAFFDAVFADVLERFPVDRDRLVISGFSQGGSMAWDIACSRGASTGAVFAPVSGGFWEPMPSSCPGGPVRIRHEHGTADRTFPLGGRALGSSYRQGDVRESIAIARQTAGCSEEPTIVDEEGRTCEVWSECQGESEIRLCIHSGGHSVTSGWHARTLAWAAQAQP